MRTLLISATCALTFAATLAAHATPDFTGSWIRDEARSTSRTTGPAPAASGTSLPIGDTVIQHTPLDLTISNEIMGMAITYRYKLDGSESVNRNGAMVQTTHSHWNGTQLVTEGIDTQSTSQGQAAWTIKATRMLDTTGHFIVDTTSTDAHGVVTTTHQVFTKSPR